MLHLIYDDTKNIWACSITPACAPDTSSWDSEERKAGSGDKMTNDKVVKALRIVASSTFLTRLWRSLLYEHHAFSASHDPKWFWHACLCCNVSRNDRTVTR